MIGRLREGTAQFTDERVRLEGEAVGGALAMKMLGWEPWLMAAIGALYGPCPTTHGSQTGSRRIMAGLQTHKALLTKVAVQQSVQSHDF